MLIRIQYRKGQFRYISPGNSCSVFVVAALGSRRGPARTASIVAFTGRQPMSTLGSQLLNCTCLVLGNLLYR